MSQVIYDATSAMDNAYDDASTFLDNDNVPLGDFLRELTVGENSHCDFIYLYKWGVYIDI